MFKIQIFLWFIFQGNALISAATEKIVVQQPISNKFLTIRDVLLESMLRRVKNEVQNDLIMEHNGKNKNKIFHNRIKNAMDSDLFYWRL